MDVESLLCCCVCDQEYSDSQIPRSFNCGHSVCSTCVDLLIPISRKCPECRKAFTENKAVQLPINYPILRVSRLFAFAKIDNNTLPELKFPIHHSKSERQQDAGECPNHGCLLFFMCVRCSVWICRECCITDHPDPPNGVCNILPVGEAIDKIKKSRTASVNTDIEESNAFRIKLERTLRILTLSIKYHSGNFEFSGKIEERRELIKTCLSRLSSLTEFLKEAKEKLNNASSPEKILAMMRESDDHQLAFTEYVTKEKGTPNILDIFGGRKKDLKELFGEGKPVHALIEEEDGKVRWGPLICWDGRLHLYSLRDGNPPEEGIKIPFELIRDLVPKESPSMFLEIGREGEIKGRVYVRMFGDTPRSRQTLFLCSGEKGPSYRNTCFYGIYEQDNMKLIRGGDYENNDGTGGRAIVEGIVSGYPYYHEAKAGLFLSWAAHETWRLASFDIYLYDAPGTYANSAHGIIEQGLEILREAANITPVADTLVMDCGLVIPVCE